MLARKSQIRVCTVCEKSYSYPSGNTKTHCNNCYNKMKRAKMKTRALELLGGCCVNCGYNRSNRALHFHHTSEDKESGISTMFMRGRPWRLIEQELMKCVILCANCHSEFHDGTIGETWLT